MKPVRIAARGMLAAIFIGGGWNQLRNAAQHAEIARPVTGRVGPALASVHPKAPSDPKTLVMIDGAVKLGGGVLLASGFAGRPAALLLASSLVPTTVAGHPFWQAKDQQERAQQRIHFLKNLAMLGGLLLAASDTEGRPSLGSRARQAVGHPGQAVRHAGHAAADAAAGMADGAATGAGRAVERAKQRTQHTVATGAKRAHQAGKAAKLTRNVASGVRHTRDLVGGKR